ncbi:MAG: N-6 DNA methylase [Gemmatimonadota bacterium]
MGRPLPDARLSVGLLVRSKERVAAHGEVFTPPELVEAMLDLVQSESERIDSRFLEPACGSGNFLVPVLARKLTVVEARYGGSDFERAHQALLALMSIYGIELLEDNVRECRDNLLGVFIGALRDLATEEWRAVGQAVLGLNIVHGDALSMTTREATPRAITFAEWSYIGKGIYRRRDFRFDTLTQMASFGEEGSLFAELGRHEIFTPDREFPPLSVRDIAEWGAPR